MQAERSHFPYRIRATMRTGVRCRFSSKLRAIYLAAWPHGEVFNDVAPSAVALLERLSSRECDIDGLRDHFWDMKTARFYDRLRDGGWITTTVYEREKPLYTLVPIRPSRRWQEAAPAERVLSRFAIMRFNGGHLVIESPGADAEIHLHEPNMLQEVGIISGIGYRSASYTGPQLAPIGSALSRLLSEDMARTGLAVPKDSESNTLRTLQWSPHELWFHSRSRAGSRGRPGVNFGGTAWAKETFPPLPAVSEWAEGPTIKLFRPDLGKCSEADPSVTAALEGRRSIRRHDDTKPICAAQLGEFLFRSARVRNVIPAKDCDAVDLPYPSGGALGGLEIYVLVHNVVDVDPGLYHYSGQTHGLERRSISVAAARHLLHDAADSAAMDALPQLVLIITARFGRVMWKYEGMAYALLLKQVGVLYQVMYLVATSMGLAPCALGAGDADTFGDAAGLDHLEESSVGEFILGSIGQ